VAKASAPETAKPILAEIFKETLLQTDAAKNFEQIQPYLKNLPPDQPLAVPGLPGLDITNGEAAGLTLDKLAGRIATETADKIYAGQLEIPSETGIDAAAFAPMSAIFSAGAHRSIANLGRALWILAALMAAVTVFFSSRFGRLAALGLGLLAGSLLPLGVFAFGAARLEAMRGAASGASTEIRTFALLTKLIKPTLETGRHAAFITLLVGFALTVAAVIGGTVWRRPTKAPPTG